MKSSDIKHIGFFSADYLNVKRLSQISSLAFSPDEQIIAVPGYKNTLYLYSLKPEGMKNREKPMETPPCEALKPVLTVKGMGGIRNVTVSPDGKYFAFIDNNSKEVMNHRIWNPDEEEIPEKEELNIYSVENRKLIHSITSLPDDLKIIHTRVLAFQPAGNLLAAKTSKELLFFSVETGQLVNMINVGSFQELLVFSPDGTLIATSSVKGKEIGVYRVSDGTLIHSFESKPEYSYGAAITNDNKVIIMPGYNGFMDFWSLETGNLIRTIPIPIRNAGKIRLSSDNSYIVVTGNSKICIISNKNREVLRTFESEDSWFSALNIMSDNKKIITRGFYDYNLLSICSIDTGEIFQSSAFAPYRITVMDVTNDGRLLFTIADDRKMEGQLDMWALE